MSSHPTLAISIATRNRLSDLESTLKVVARLDPPPDEVLVCADGCTDGTVSWVRERFPLVRLLIHEEARGSIVSRDRILREAASDIVLSLDDDSHPIEADFVARVKELFAATPRLAVASFPQRSDEFPETLLQADFGPSLRVGGYVNCAAAFRHSTYLEIGPFDLSFFHAYDEPDYALRCLARDWEIHHHTGITVRHRYSSKERSELRTHQNHARNEQWSLWKRCPFPQLLFLSIFRCLRQFQYACRRGPRWIIREPLWWLAALRGLGAALRDREPISWGVYSRWLRLLRHPEPLPSAGKGSC